MLANRDPSGPYESSSTAPSWACRVSFGEPSRASQIRIAPSSPPVANVSPSGLKATTRKVSCSEETAYRTVPLLASDVRSQTVEPSKQWAVERELRLRIKEALDDAGMEIPFPQTTVWLRSEGDHPIDPTPDPASVVVHELPGATDDAAANG